jgi:ribosomal protein S12 methylthiotransferase
MEAQAKISAAKLKARVGKTYDVLVDAVQDGTAVTRSQAEAPEIDGVIYVEGAKDLKPGDFIRVRIARSDDHDLWAVPATT